MGFLSAIVSAFWGFCSFINGLRQANQSANDRRIGETIQKESDFEQIVKTNAAQAQAAANAPQDQQELIDALKKGEV